MASLASASPGGTPSQQQQPVTAMQQQQQQPQNQQQQQQAQQATPAGQPQAPAEPGFFGRMFRRQKPGAAAGAPAAGASAAAQGQGQQQAQVADAPTSAGCCAKKWTAQDEQNAEKLRQAPVNASRFACLRSGAQVSQVTPGSQGPTWNPSAPAADQPPGITTTLQSGPPPENAVAGPFLRFGGFDPASYAYYASVLVVVHQSKGVKPPTLRFRDVDVPRSETNVLATHLCHYRGFNFWRFDLTILCGLPQRTVEYIVVLASDHAFTFHNKYCFFVPGVAQKWRWGFYSCNGFDNPKFEPQMGGIQPLWRDVLHCHEEKPLHIMIGGGDQLYNDPVWNLPALVQWLQIQDRNIRLAHPFTQEMSDQVEWYYFSHYVKHWSEPMFSDALATIPQIMIWDDHDIFDGWGSYPAVLQQCPVFQGIFYMARKFYCLFQQHSTPERIHQDNQVFGEYGWNWVGCLGTSTAVLVMDTRTERSREFVVRPASWVMIQQQLAALPSSIKHVVVVATVPFIYPKIAIVEASLGFLTGQGRMAQSVNAFMQKTGLASMIANSFGEIEVLDDLLDHWSANVHAHEKLAVLHMLQDMAQARNFRFTFLSGDVHVGGLGRFYSEPKVNLRYDHRFMPQIISSAIGNRPPPKAVVTALNLSAKREDVDVNTKETMLKMFEGGSALMASRNWCLVQEHPYVPGSPGNDGSLVFQLRVERPKGVGQRPQPYDISVPVLEGALGGTAQARLRPFALAGVQPPPMATLPMGGPMAMQQQQQQQFQQQLLQQQQQMIQPGAVSGMPQPPLGLAPGPGQMPGVGQWPGAAQSQQQPTVGASLQQPGMEAPAAGGHSGSGQVPHARASPGQAGVAGAVPQPYGALQGQAPLHGQVPQAGMTMQASGYPPQQQVQGATLGGSQQGVTSTAHAAVASQFGQQGPVQPGVQAMTSYAGGQQGPPQGTAYAGQAGGFVQGGIPAQATPEYGAGHGAQHAGQVAYVQQPGTAQGAAYPPAVQQGPGFAQPPGAQQGVGGMVQQQQFALQAPSGGMQAGMGNGGQPMVTYPGAQAAAGYPGQQAITQQTVGAH